MRSFVVLTLVAACRWDFDPHAPLDARVIDATRLDASSVDPIGCSDGTREAFVDPIGFPAIAGCKAGWAATDLRTAATGASCGNSLGACTVPADACAVGWHMCGTSGDGHEVSARASSAACAQQVGAYILATSHCSAEVGPTCSYDEPLPCLNGQVPCSEPGCCGTGCNSGDDCKDGVYEDGTTTIAGNNGSGPGNSCADFDSSLADGVLCCR